MESLTDIGKLTPDEIVGLYRIAVRDIFFTRIVSCVSATIIFYDFVISFEREVELVWRKRWSTIKVAFLWFRYFGICCAIIELSGRFWTEWEAWSGTAMLLTTELVQVLWIFVLFNRNYRILYALLILLIGEFAACVTLLVSALPHIITLAHFIPGKPLCVSQSSSNSFYKFWIPVLAFHTVLLVLYLYQGYKVFGKRKPLGLLGVLYKDSLLNFLAICAMFLVCVVMWASAEIGLRQIPVSITRALVITNCTRLLLNIRHAYYNRIVVRVGRIRNMENAVGSVDEDDEIQGLEDDARPKSLHPDTNSCISFQADEIPDRLWAFELREMRWEGAC